MLRGTVKHSTLGAEVCRAHRDSNLTDDGVRLLHSFPAETYLDATDFNCFRKSAIGKTLMEPLLSAVAMWCVSPLMANEASGLDSVRNGNSNTTAGAVNDASRR